MKINNSSPEHHLLRKIYRHVDFSFIPELVIRRMEPFPSSDNRRLGSVSRCSEALLYWGTDTFIPKVTEKE
jgi:hypothetical protein